MPSVVYVALEAISHSPEFTILGVYKSHVAAVARCQKYAQIAGVWVSLVTGQNETLFRIQEWQVLDGES